MFKLDKFGFLINEHEFINHCVQNESLINCFNLIFKLKLNDNIYSKCLKEEITKLKQK